MIRISRSLPLVRPGLSIAMCVSAVVALLVIGGMMSGGTRTAHADMDCAPLGDYDLCIRLDPETASNPVNTDHTATATLTWGGVAHTGEPVTIVVFDGPNDEEGDEGVTDGNGQFPLTYTGAGGPGTDSIIGLNCAPDPQSEQVCDGVIQSLIDCPNPGLDPTCLAAAEAWCWDAEACVFDVATKEWVEPTPTPTPTATATPTATPTATATPTPTPEAAPAAELPATGGQPPDGGSSGLPWLAVIASAIAVMSTGGLWFAYQRRRAR